MFFVYPDKDVVKLKLVFHFMKKYWYMALLAAGFMIAEVYVDLYQPRMMAMIVDEGILGLSNGGGSYKPKVGYTAV